MVEIKIQERYRWEAQRFNGEVITEGGDLLGCVRFSLIPDPRLSLPRHDFEQVPMIRRFCRGFVNALGGGMKGYLHCIVFESFRIYVSYGNGAVLITPPDFEFYM